MPQVTDSPLYMIASDMTFWSVATVHDGSLPFPYCGSVATVHDDSLLFPYCGSVQILFYLDPNFKLLACFCDCTGRFVSDLFENGISHDNVHVPLFIVWKMNVVFMLHSTANVIWRRNLSFKSQMKDWRSLAPRL